MTGMLEPIVQMTGIVKRFGRLEALKGVDCTFYKGQITALVGDNGAGKSTLTKILCGVFAPDEGRLLFDGEEVYWRNPVEARNAGIETVYQDLALVDSLSVSRNFFLGKEPLMAGFFLNRRKMNREALAAVADLGIRLTDPHCPVSDLSGGQRKSIAIARSLYFKPKLLILDEPNAAISIKESRILLEHVELVRGKGIPVIFITHNIHHVYPVADRFILLEQGSKIADVGKHEVTPEELIEAIVTGVGIPSTGKHAPLP